MKNLIYLSFIAFIINIVGCKTDTQTSIEIKKENATFPTSWVGAWEGPLIISSSKTDTVTMKFYVDTIANNDTVIWQLLYENQDIRDYRLIAKNKEKGEYVIDEKNSILIDARLFDQKLSSVFEVQNNAIVASYEYIDDSIIFELMMYNSDNKQVSGNSILENEDIPEVISHMPQVYQKAILKRVKDQ
jgi:hypothetical protein